MADETNQFTKEDFDNIAKMGDPVERDNAYLVAKQYQNAIDSYLEASTSGTDDVSFIGRISTPGFNPFDGENVETLIENLFEFEELVGP